MWLITALRNRVCTVQTRDENNDIIVTTFRGGSVTFGTLTPLKRARGISRTQTPQVEQADFVSFVALFSTLADDLLTFPDKTRKSADEDRHSPPAWHMFDEPWSAPFRSI